MPRLAFQGRTLEIAPGETVLETLLREGFSIPNSCRAGVCQSCLLKAVSGSIPDEARKGLRESHRLQGYFLGCVCRPNGDLSVVEADEGLSCEVELAEVRPLSASVLRVRWRALSDFEYAAGQFVNLQRPDGLTRSFSLASLPDETHLEMHIRRVENGRMSGWLFEEAIPGERLRVKGPFGDCHYVPGAPEQPMLLVGTGTGLAPLYGLLRDALAQGHRGRIDLYHGGRTESDLYFREVLAEIAERFDHVQYCPVVREGAVTFAGGRKGNLEDEVLANVPAPAEWKSYLCGNPTLVKSLQKKLFLAGQSLMSIHSDAFLPSAS